MIGCGHSKGAPGALVLALLGAPWLALDARVCLADEPGAAIPPSITPAPGPDAPAFEFHGYLRSGYGLNDGGGRQVAFQAPGAGAKYRLGNEADSYGRFAFVNNWINPAHAADEAWLRSEVMLQVDTTNSHNYSDTDRYRLREGFVEAGNLLRAQPNMRVWAGERDYRRQDIHIIDFFGIDMAGYGGGVENVELGFGRFAIALFGASNESVDTDRGAYSKLSLDARLYDVPAPLGRWEFWAHAAHVPGGSLGDGARVEPRSGWALGVRHRTEGVWVGYNDLLVAYGVGAASSLRNDPPVPPAGAVTAEAAQFLVADQLLLEAGDDIAVMPAFVYRRSRTGVPTDGVDQWLSLGVRPIFFVSDHVSLALESGLDWVSDGRRRYEGWLQKLTIAPQIGAGRGFFSRPVLRAFATFASWSSGLRGYVGGEDYADRSWGATYGVQVEAWW